MGIKRFLEFSDNTEFEGITPEDVSSLEDIFDDLTDSDNISHVNVGLIKDYDTSLSWATSKLNLGDFSQSMFLVPGFDEDPALKKLIDTIRKNMVTVSIRGSGIIFGMGFREKLLQLSTDKVKMAEKYLNLTYIWSDTNSPGHGKFGHVLFFIKNKERIEEMFRKETFVSKDIKESIDNTNSSDEGMSILQDIFAEIEETTDVKVESSIGYSSFWICYQILPRRCHDKLKLMWANKEGFFEFCDSLLKDKTYEVTVGNLEDSEYAQICLRAEKYGNLSAIYRDKYRSYSEKKYTSSIIFLRDEKIIVQKILNEIQKYQSK